jgi:large subunit ribosomal protein L31
VTTIKTNYAPSQASCSCGNTFATQSTNPRLTVEVCSACHPFYTGRTKLVDPRGRIERFNRRHKLHPR